MLIVSKESLSMLLNIVANDRVGSQDRLSQAIPTEILLCYEAELVKDTVTFLERLFMALAIPLASRQSDFTVFRAFPTRILQSEL